jgi:hypothetical protein
LIFRFTRIGVVAILIALIPIILLFQQNNLLSIQNKRLDQQTYLLEAERRGSLVHLFSNVLDAKDIELREDYNIKGKRDLSPQLIGRIISLSKALKPYHYLESDTITRQPISPERGQLLTSLLASDLDSISLLKILKEGDFKYSGLEDVRFSYITLSGLDLTYSNLRNARFENVNFYKCTFHKANLEKSNFNNSSLLNCMFTATELKLTSFKHCNLKNVNFSDARLEFAFFFSSSYDNVYLNDPKFHYTKIDSTLKEYLRNKKNIVNFEEMVKHDTVFQLINERYHTLYRLNSKNYN